jgi:hypothetical protein
LVRFVPNPEVTRHAIPSATPNDIIQSALDEISDHRHGSVRCIGDHAVPAIRKPFELNEVRTQRRRDIRLAVDGMNWIVFPAHHQSRTLDAT